MRPLFVLLVAASALRAQGEPPPSGSIRGTITDATTAAPLLGLTVSATSVQSKQLTTQTDAQGRYRLQDLAPGAYFLNITGAEIASISSRDVPVKAGQDVKADFALELAARVSGRVTDWEKKPAPKATVVLVEEIYRHGAVAHVPAMSAQTDEDGRYVIGFVQPLRRYAIMAKPFTYPQRVKPGTTPDPEREFVAATTFWPGAESVDRAQTIELRSGQNMEGVDIQMFRGRTRCASGSLVPAELAVRSVFEVLDTLPVSAAGNRSMSVGVTREVSSDGRFRVCGLPRGAYLLSVRPLTGMVTPADERTASFTVVDKDVTDLKIVSPGTVAVPVLVVWEGDDADITSGPRKERGFGIGLRLGDRTEHVTSNAFTIPDVPIGGYPVDVLGLGSGWYVKEMRYGSVDVLHQTIPVGGASDLRIVIAHDTGTLTGLVTDSDGKPLPSINVWVMPLSVGSAAEMEQVLETGTTDDRGTWHGALPPGKYRVLATRERFEHTAAQMDRLWNERLRGAVVEVPANGLADVRLELTPIN